MAIDTAVATAIGNAVTEISTGISTVTGWWFVPVALAIFGASITITLIASFFGKRGRRRRGK